ncbi:MAG: pentapeptide repeat-containing protein, partial [Rickettsiales bacterium]
MPPSSPAKPYPIENEIDINSQLHLMRLAVSLMQKRTSEEALRQKYRRGEGIRNKQGGWRKEGIARSKIRDLQNSLTYDSSQVQTQITEVGKSPEIVATDEVDAVLENPKSDLKRLSKTEIEEFLKNARDNKIFVEGIDFSKMDLSDLDLNNLSFRNCNFSGAKFPSIDGVFFDNSCNLESSDFSNITIGKVFFGAKTLQYNMYDLVYNIGKNQILMSRAVEFNEDHQFQSFKSDIDKKSQSQIQSEITDLRAKTIQKPVILKVTNANFSSTKFENFYASNADFSSSNFTDARIRINQGFPESGSISIDIFDVDGVDLTGAFFEIFDNQGQKIQETHGTQSFNFSNINPDLKCVIGNCGVMSQEFVEKMQSGKEILVLINGDNQKIPKGLKMQSADPDYKDFEFTSHQDLKATELKSVELCNHYFGRYNIKFITEEMLDGREPDQILHLNFFNLKAPALVDFNNFYGFGNKEMVISFNPELAKQDFWSIFLHEMSHMFFQHPKTLASLSYPTKISYLPPMVMRPDSNSVMV